MDDLDLDRIDVPPQDFGLGQLKRRLLQDPVHVKLPTLPESLRSRVPPSLRRASRSESDLASVLRGAAHADTRSRADALRTKHVGTGIEPTPNPLTTRILLIMVAPLLPYVAYSLSQFFQSWRMFAYFLFCVAYLIYMLAFAITELAIRPWWYHPNPPDKGLTQLDLPAYWNGVSKNPLEDFHIPYEDIQFDTVGGFTLRGWYIPGDARLEQHQPVGLVFAHGGGFDRRSWLRHVPLWHRRGFCLLLFDLSGHGNSDGAGLGLSFGVRENFDVSAAVKYMREVKLFEKVVVVGTSVGGASVLTAAARDPNIDGVIAENPVSHAANFAVEHLRRLAEQRGPWWTHIVLAPFYALVSRVFVARIGALWGYQSPLSLVSRISPRPLLLMHGTADDTVLMSHSEALFANAKEPKYLWCAPDAWHCALYDKYPREYEQEVFQFLGRHFVLNPLEPVTTRDIITTMGDSGLLNALVSDASLTPRGPDQLTPRVAESLTPRFSDAVMLSSSGDWSPARYAGSHSLSSGDISRGAMSDAARSGQ